MNSRSKVRMAESITRKALTIGDWENIDFRLLICDLLSIFAPDKTKPKEKA